MRSFLFFLYVFIFAVRGHAQDEIPEWRRLAPPDTIGAWVQPAPGKPAMPVWGHANGITVGLSPLPGPRGLIRIYTPYLSSGFPDVMNFIALEPVPGGSEHRGLSELEMSTLDEGKRGKRFWSSNDSMSVLPLDEEYPARGVIKKIKGEETLSFYVFSEPFDNGARVYTRLRFFESRPYEFEITTYTYAGSVDLDYMITTATMGNKARLRTLYLKDGQQSSLELWPDYRDMHFAPHRSFSQQEMIQDSKGQIYFIAAPNEKDYGETVFAPGTSPNWKYKGKPATQYWIKTHPYPGLSGLVNGRFVYWASEAPIPGGIAFENFEMKEPFRNGATFVFGISPEEPEKFISHREKGPYQ